MKVQALVSFTGCVTMHKNEIQDITDDTVVKDLLRAGYVIRVFTNEETATEQNGLENVAQETATEQNGLENAVEDKKQKTTKKK